MNWKLALPLAILIALSLPASIAAHGAKIDYQIDLAVEIQALFDTGSPMAGGQVTVYAPGDPSTPWLTGVCDDEGRFSFSPDSARPGTWDVQVRQSGHGAMIHIPIGEDAPAAGTTGLSAMQIVLMGACVIWGFVGTALFFVRRRA